MIHCALSGWGQTGPYNLKAGHDLNYMALGGGLVASGVGERPVIAWPPTSDYASGVQAAAAVCGALVRRGQDRRGAFIDMSLTETVLAWQSGGLTMAQRGDLAPTRATGIINGGAACYQIYETSDGRFLTIGNLEEKFWANFAAAVGHPEWSSRQWEPMPQEALIAEVQGVVETRTLAEWEDILAEVDTCFQAALEFAEVPDHPHVVDRQMVLSGGNSEEPLIEVPFPAWIDGNAPPTRRPVVEIEPAEAIDRWRT